MTNMPHIVETALLLLVAFLIGCVIGYLLRSVFAPKRAAPEGRPVSSPAKSAVEKAPPVQPKPVAAAVAVESGEGKYGALPAPRNGTKDDLKRIKGIGPGIEKKLNDLGIYHFDQIAGWGRADIAAVDESLSFKGRISRENWVAQAKDLEKS